MDFYIFQQINQLAFRWLWLDTLAIFFANYFEYVLILCLFLFLVKNYKKYWLMVIQAILSAVLARFVITEFIRLILPRARPFVENNVNLLLDHSLSPSFPSGHASFYFAIATIVYFYNKKAGYLFFLAAFLISISRVFVGLHWPSDILVGAIVGILSALAISKIFLKLKPNEQN